MKLFLWSCHRVMSASNAAGVMASCARLHLPDCCKLHAEFPKVKVERCGDLSACSCISATAAHLTTSCRCSALGWSGRSTDDEGRYLQHQDRFHRYFGLCKRSRITCVFDQPPLICDLQPVVRFSVCIHVVRFVNLFPRRSRASLPLQGCSQAPEFRQI